MGLTFGGDDREAPPARRDPTAPAQGSSFRLPARSATWILIAVNVALFGLEMLWGGSTNGETLWAMGAATGRGELVSEPWRVLASAFLHIGPLHLLLNMWALYVFGSSLERLLGWSRLVVLYTASALGGGLLSALVHEKTLAAGASGAVWGLMVGEIVLLLRVRRRAGPEAVPIRPLVIAQPLIVNLIFSLQANIDLAAHLGGGLAGGTLLALLRLPLARDDRAWRRAAMVGAALMALAVMTALAVGRPWEADASLT